jgi:hypothetical protein
MGREGRERKEKKQLSVYQLSECEGAAARWEKVLAEEEGGRRASRDAASDLTEANWTEKSGQVRMRCSEADVS